VAAILRVATVNILNDRSRWDERRPLLVANLRSCAADLIALQEVTNPLGESTAHELASDLGGYSVHLAPQTGSGRRREGIATLSRLPVEGHEVIDLQTQRRVAQVVHTWVGDRPVAFGNGHYYWHPGSDKARVRQVKRVLDRLGELDPATAIIACGDFNGLPGSPAIATMERSLASAYRACHGREPDFTCPTPLTSRHRLRGFLTRTLLRLGTNRSGESWRGTLDYIFVGPGVGVLDADVFLDQSAAADPTLYPSDHLGLWATLDVAAQGP